MSQSFNICFKCGCNFNVSLVGLSDLCLDCINKKDIWMSDKTIEEKFKEWHKDMPCENYYPYEFLFKAGYLLAQKEMQEKLDAAIEVIKGLSGHAKATVQFPHTSKVDLEIAISIAHDFLKARGG